MAKKLAGERRYDGEMKLAAQIAIAALTLGGTSCIPRPAPQPTYEATSTEPAFYCGRSVCRHAAGACADEDGQGCSRAAAASCYGGRGDDTYCFASAEVCAISAAAHPTRPRCETRGIESRQAATGTSAPTSRPAATIKRSGCQKGCPCGRSCIDCSKTCHK